MTQRLNLVKPNPGLEAMTAIEAWLDQSIDPKLLALVKVRASQINGCEYCLHMHSEQALKLGESTARLLLLDAWQESALYSERERAALAWTDSLTRVSETHAPDADFERVRRNFSDEELTALSIAIAMINAWNRLAIGARAQHPSDIRKAA
jgi:AhpD family alkylhydroperoxidase